MERISLKIYDVANIVAVIVACIGNNQIVGIIAFILNIVIVIVVVAAVTVADIGTGIVIEDIERDIRKIWSLRR